MAHHRIQLTVNGELEQVDVPSNMTLFGMMRVKLTLTGTKNGCTAGECGACTVLVNGEPLNSCMILAVECSGAKITTVEGLPQDGKLDPAPIVGQLGGRGDASLRVGERDRSAG